MTAPPTSKGPLGRGSRRSLAGELSRLVALALPVVVTQVGYMLFGVVDLAMVGHVGREAIAAAALGNTWAVGTLLVGYGVVLGIDPFVSQAHGARDAPRMGLALQRGVVVALAVSLPTAVAWAFAEPALRLAGQDPELCARAARYVHVQIPSVPCFLVFTALRQYLQGRGIVAPALWVTLGANVLNAVGNWLLIFGPFELPALGLTGCGVSTSITRASMVLGLYLWIRHRRLLRGGWTRWTRAAFAPRGLREFLDAGLPVGVQIAAEVWAFQLATLMAGRLGATELAGHSIALNVASLAFMVPLGLSLGTASRVGNLLGAGDPAGARRTAWIALGLAAAVMTVPAAAFVLLRDELPRLYTGGEPAVVAACAAILPVAAAFQLFDGIQVVGCAVLRGMGRTRPAAAFNVVGYYGLALPLGAWLTFSAGLGLPGIWWGLAVGLATVAGLVVYWIAAAGPGEGVGSGGAAPRARPRPARPSERSAPGGAEAPAGPPPRRADPR